MSQAQPQLHTLLPDSVHLWSASGQDKTYGRDDLFDYINGGAELYLSYSFRQLTTRTYSSIPWVEEETLSLDIPGSM